MPRKGEEISRVDETFQREETPPVDTFYSRFEERYRGSRERVKERLEIYLPFVRPILQGLSEAKILDLGCGRGEWLELMQEQGARAEGVDLDEGMLLRARMAGLRVHRADALEFLSECAEESLAVVSAFHLVEHLPFETLRQMVAESFRALRPGGLLILETPNPENIHVATESFYLDPTHRNPIPSDLLRFLAEASGFAPVKILRLQEDSALIEARFVNIGQLLAGVSPDYAVVAQKPGSGSLTRALTEPLSREYGLSLSDLVEKFENRMLYFQEEIGQIRVESVERLARAEAAVARSLEEAARIRQEHAHILQSRSWRLTAPLRSAGALYRKGRDFLKPVLRRGLGRILRSIEWRLRSHPRFKRALLKLLHAFPSLHRRLKRWSRGDGHISSGVELPIAPSGGEDSFEARWYRASPRARELYEQMVQKHEEERR